MTKNSQKLVFCLISKYWSSKSWSSTQANWWNHISPRSWPAFGCQPLLLLKSSTYMLVDPLFGAYFFSFALSLLFFTNVTKTDTICSKMIYKSEQCVKHPFAGRNTHHILWSVNTSQNYLRDTLNWSVRYLIMLILFSY